MKIPIANSLYSNFYINKPSCKNFSFQKNLSFHNADIKKIPSIKILKLTKILNDKGFILINSLNEILVEKFMDNKILFTDIVHKLLNILDSKAVKNHLKNHQIRHIKDVFKTYNFSRSLVN
jgi:1-deoxy-D-xylulose 5-phosphate reductoisomerase